jgi:hypothetical protein
MTVSDPALVPAAKGSCGAAVKEKAAAFRRGHYRLTGGLSQRGIFFGARHQ